MDIYWHNNHSSLPEINEYERMCALKTGCLARMASVLALVCVKNCPGDKKPEINPNLTEKIGLGAEKLGIGFQILDDIKNLTTGIPGKKRGDDIVEGKKSLPVLLYLHRYPEKHAFATSCFKAARSAGTTAPELVEFIEALENAGVMEEAGKRSSELIRESRQILTNPEIFRNTQSKELLGG